MGKRKKKRYRFRYKKDRVLLSDTLPYEIPIIMSNRFFYRFCVKNQIHYDNINNVLFWSKRIDPVAFKVLKLLFKASTKDNTTWKIEEGKIKLDSHSSIPFQFKILHKKDSFRTLSIVHPVSQLGVVNFYDQYKSLIIHYCTRNSFSIRHPQKVASYFYYTDRLHHKLLGAKRDNIELFVKEYENLKTFFSYKKYTQIYKFYDDYRFQRAEKNFSFLMVFDIQKCFDSIYTHTIAWATQGGKNAYKKYFKSKEPNTFGGCFDRLMQRANFNETHGIVIGPEFSRIFAEVILQQVDCMIRYKLELQNIKYGSDYLIYRYVDDYFLFYNNDWVRYRIIELVQQELEEYKLHISPEKTRILEKPLITDISRAKIRINSLVSRWIKSRSIQSKDSKTEINDEEKDIGNSNCKDSGTEFIIDTLRLQQYVSAYDFYPLNSLKFNQEFKDILVTTNVKAREITNYMLACINNQLERELNKFLVKYDYIKLAILSGCTELESELKSICIQHLKKLEIGITRYLSNVIDATFFLFTQNQRITSSLKLLSTINTILSFLSGKLSYKHKENFARFDNTIKYVIYNKIQYEVVNLLTHSTCHDYAQLEILYLLIGMRAIDATHPISPEILTNHLNLNQGSNAHFLNYISFNTVLFYIGNKQIYNNLKILLLDNLKQYLKNKDLVDYTKDTESIMLSLDLACCPYVTDSDKKEIWKIMQFTDQEIKDLNSFSKHNPCIFTKWTGININKELAAKISIEVYS